eukprot:6492251-Amphidinium_carterae.1
MHQWTVAAWNTRGLLHTDPVMLKCKKSELERLCKGAEIVVLLETHGCLLDPFFHPDIWLTTATAHPLNPTAAGGVGIAIRWSCLNRDTFDSVEIVPGRVLQVSWTWSGVPFVLTACHVTPDAQVDLSWHDIIASVRYHLCDSGSVQIAIGDFNCVAGPEDVLYLKGTQGRIDASRERHLSQTFPCWSIVSPGLSLEHVSSGTLRAVDKCLVNTSLVVLQVVRCDARIAGHSLHPPAGSDHWPILCTFGATEERSSDIIPRHLVDHPAWQACFESHVVALWASLNTWQAKWSAVEIAAQKTADELSASVPFPVCSPRLAYVTCVRALRVLRRR